MTLMPVYHTHHIPEMLNFLNVCIKRPISSSFEKTPNVYLPFDFRYVVDQHLSRIRLGFDGLPQLTHLCVCCPETRFDGIGFCQCER